MKSIIFCACEKVLIDRVTGSHSLISVMVSAEARFSGTLPPELPINAVLPSMWFVYGMWETSAEDAGKSHEQVLEIYWPNGDKFLDNRLPFVADAALRAQNSVGVVGFPGGQKGDIKILAWIEHDGQPVSDIAEYHVTVKHPETIQSPTSTSPVTAGQE